MAAKQFDYPNHNIDPYDKNESWILQHVQAAWMDSYANCGNMFAAKREHYNLNRAYALCKQPTEKYRTPYEATEGSNISWVNIDATPRAFQSKYLDSIVAKMLQQEYRPTATPIDSDSTDKANDYLSGLKARLALADRLKQNGAGALASHPMLQVSSTEPQDMEEYQMRVDMGEQFLRSMDAEGVIALVFYENDVRYKFREALAKDARDFGVCGFRDDLDANNRPILRKSDVKRFIPANFCRESDFSDMQGGGEVIRVAKVDLAKHFTEGQLKNIYNVSNPFPPIGGFGNLRSDEKFVNVWDFCFYSTNKTAWTKVDGKDGQKKIIKADPNGTKDKIAKDIRVVYQCKWIIGTDLVYDCGLMTNMKRYSDPKKIANTSLPFHFWAYNFDDETMSCQSYMDRLRPIIDESMHDVCKMQQFVNAMVPNSFAVDKAALLKAADDPKGDTTPKGILKMFTQSGILVWDSSNGLGEGINNYKPVEKLENSNVNELLGLFQKLNMTKAQLAEVTGYNEITDGSTPDPKNLSFNVQSAQEGTNNALFPLFNTMQRMLLSAAENSLLRAKQSIKLNGSYSGFVPALNTATMQLISADRDITLRDHGIMIEIMATEAQRQFIIQQMQGDIAQGLLDTSDMIRIMFDFNLKHAAMLLAFKVKQSRNSQQQQKSQDIQSNSQAQQASNQQTAQNAIQLLQTEYGLKSQIEAQVQQGKEKLLMMQIQATHAGIIESNHGTILAKNAEAKGKENVANIGQGNPTQPPPMEDPNQQQPIQQQAA